MLRQVNPVQRPDFVLGDLRISPATRRVVGPGGLRHIEPQFIVVFLRLLDTAGAVVTRNELFEECWGGSAVGDDSLNRAIAGARQIASGVGSQAFTIETVPRTGYVLRLAPDSEISASPTERANGAVDLQLAVEEAYDCWRSGRPAPDVEAVRALESALAIHGGDGRAWGVQALLMRKAAEYADADECSDYVRRCEQAARRALARIPGQPDARVALAGVVPIFGNWTTARRQLRDVLHSEPDHVPAAHDMAVLEMATGRPSAAQPIIERLVARDPLAATFYYKRMYHLWTSGEVDELDRVATRALQLWPRHPAVWSARLWTLVFTGRADQAGRFVADESSRPPVPPRLVDLLQRTCAVADASQSGSGRNSPGRKELVAMAVESAGKGPAQAVAALMALCAVDAISEAFDVAHGYYLGRGAAAAPVRRNPDDPSITDQHRRVTQPLFIPSAARMREDPRFLKLCADLGLRSYWDEFGIAPDFMT